MNCMRADAVRNLEAVLLTGARVLARDPTASMAAIAREAGVDRSTVYRRFPTREALLAAVFQAKLDAAERGLDAARLEEAPIPVALHRLVDETVEVSRRWPVDVARMRQDPAAARRSDELRERIEAFVARAARAGLVREDLPERWARDLLIGMMDLAAHRQRDLPSGVAADLVSEAFLRAVGSS
jgi:AcrR family transcriptional regulator